MLVLEVKRRSLMSVLHRDNPAHGCGVAINRQLNAALRFACCCGLLAAVLTTHAENEYLTCEVSGQIVALVPDLISVLESETGRAVGTEELKYGLRVSVIAIPCSPLLCSPQALEVVGPSAFGLETAFEPGQVGDYREPASAFSGDKAKL